MSNTHCIYFLTNGLTRSYIGYSKGPAGSAAALRFRKHSLKLAAAPQATKRFDQCFLLATIEGFPCKRSALRAEWLAKRRTLAVHKQRLRLPQAPHTRLDKFFAPLLHPKILPFKAQLTLFVHDVDQTWSSALQAHYGVPVHRLSPPFHTDHCRKGTRFYFPPLHHLIAPALPAAQS